MKNLPFLSFTQQNTFSEIVYRGSRFYPILCVHSSGLGIAFYCKELFRIISVFWKYSPFQYPLLFYVRQMPKDRNLFFGAHFWYLTTKIMLQKIESSSTWKHIKQIKHEKRKSRSYRS